MLDSDLEFLRHHHADALAHSGRSLLDHLRGTAALLDAWGVPPHVVRAGLFHSVYGTGAFPDAALSAPRRGELAARIGAPAESLVYLFCSLDRASLYANVDRAGEPAARCRHSGATIPLSRAQVRELFHLASANWVEQRAHLDAALRREHCAVYRRMLDHLEPRARTAVEAAIAEALAAPPPPSLVDLLAFEDLAAVDRQCAELDVRYLGLVSHRLHAVLDPPRLERLGRLGDDAYLALLRAPETCYRVFADGDDLAAYIDDALLVEEWRDGARGALERAAWSATGDLHVPAGPVREPAAVFAPDRLYRAPTLGGFTIDLCSPAAHRALDQIVYKRVPFGPNEPFTDGERALVLDRLAGAIAGIERTNPITTRFLRYSLHTIIPRKQTQPHLYPSSFKGSSTEATVHRAIIYNIQQPNVDIARLAQSIIHEAVHNHLYKRELFEPTLTDDAAGKQLRVRSPWSGNTLDLYVFVHSTVVYYALYRFFSNPAAPAHLPADTAAWFRDRAVAGFSSPAWAEIARAHGSTIAPGVRRDLWAMRELVAGGAR